MTSAKKPLLAVIALMTALFAGFLLAGPASAAYPAGSTAGISISPTNPSCGDKVTITGSHYNPGEEVSVTVDGQDEGTFTADSQGNFSGQVTLVCNGTGPVSIKASGNQGDVDALTVSTGGGSGNGGGGGGGNNGGGGLSDTGVAVVGIGAVGVVLLLGGGLLLFAGKRRRVTA